MLALIAASTRSFLSTWNLSGIFRTVVCVLTLMSYLLKHTYLHIHTLHPTDAFLKLSKFAGASLFVKGGSNLTTVGITERLGTVQHGLSLSFYTV